MGRSPSPDGHRGAARDLLSFPLPLPNGAERPVTTAGQNLGSGIMGTSHGEAWLRALCVDDNKDCADSAAMLLRVMGFEAKACYDGKTALELNESFRPGVCFLDCEHAGDGRRLSVQEDALLRRVAALSVGGRDRHEQRCEPCPHQGSGVPPSPRQAG